MLRKSIKTTKLIAVISLFVVVAVVVAISIKQAAEMNQLHAQMRDKVESISDFHQQQMKEYYLNGFKVYYSLRGYSGIYPMDRSDTLFEKFEMERWAVEISDIDNSVRLLVPEISYSPEFADIKDNGWYLSGEVGSSITLTNPRLDPNGLGTIHLEVLYRFEEGIVFLIGLNRSS